MTAHRRPTMKTAMWLMLTASILFAGNAMVGGVEWRFPAHNFRNNTEHSFAIAFTTEMLFWLVLPIALGMLSASTQQASRPCWAVAVGVLALYVIIAYNADRVFGFTLTGYRAEVVTLSALFGPLLAVEVPAMMVSAGGDILTGLMIYGIWLGFYVMATDKIVGSLKPKLASEVVAAIE